MERLVSPIGGHKLPRLLMMMMRIVVAVVMMIVIDDLRTKMMMICPVLMIVTRMEMILLMMVDFSTLTSRPWRQRALPTGSPCKGWSEAPARHNWQKFLGVMVIGVIGSGVMLMVIDGSRIN